MCMTKGLQKEFYNVEDQKETTLDSCGAFYTLFSPSTIYILFAYSFRILVQNRVYILEYGKNTAPNRAYILEYSLYSTR